MYADDELISIKELESFLREYGNKVICVGCGEPLYHDFHVDRYPHDGGIRVKEYGGEKQWVYIHHEKCGYDMALWKMEQRLYNLNKSLFSEYVKRVYEVVENGRR